jgi:hypothetical protein
MVQTRAIGSITPQNEESRAASTGFERKAGMRKALVVGIDYYPNMPKLFGCVNDARAVAAVLEHHGDGTPNFGVRLLTGAEPAHAVSRRDLKDNIKALFSDDSDVALLYFAGHGHIEVTGGYLCSSDAESGDDGLSLQEVLTLANKSRARNKVIVLDSCHSGIAGTPPGEQLAHLSEGTTILTASTDDQYASEQNGSGVFTTLFVDALEGGASNIVGQITPGSVYAHIDQSLGAWEQRPVFKTNVKQFVSLRTVPPPISRDDLQRITTFFPVRGFEFPVDPTFEDDMKGRPPNAPPPDPENVAKFAVLRRYHRLNLLVPVGAPYMWHAAMESKSCKLTSLGEHYRRLVERGRI